MRSIRIVLLAGIAAGLWTPAVQGKVPFDQRPADPAAAAKANWQTRTIGTPNYGLTTPVYYRLGATELDPDTSATTYTSTWDPFVADYNYLRWVTGGNFPHLIGFGHLPGGSAIATFQVSYCDTNALAPHMTINLYNCDQAGACNPTPLISYDTGSLPPGCFNVIISGGGLPGYTVDNNFNQLMVDVVFRALDGTQQIASVAFGYVLQVSPAPGTPTFTDVPISDGAFQFIEAFGAAGITAGCQAPGDPPAYCPDGFVTRRQIAIFFAKALGLNWSQ